MERKISVLTIIRLDLISGNLAICIGVAVFLYITKISIDADAFNRPFLSSDNIFFIIIYIGVLVLVTKLFTRVMEIKLTYTRGTLVHATVLETKKFPFGYRVTYAYKLDNQEVTKDVFFNASVCEKTIDQMKVIDVIVNPDNINKNLIKDFFIYT